MFSTQHPLTAKEAGAAEALSALSVGLPLKEKDDDNGPLPSASPTTDSTLVTEASAAEQKKSPAAGDGDDEEIIMDDDDDDEGGDVQNKPPSAPAKETPVTNSSSEAAKALAAIADGKGGASLLKGEKGKFISNNKVKRASKYKGVGFDSKMGKWKARVHYEHKDIMVGSFETEGEAALAYDEKARELFGEEAVTNFDRNGDWNPNAKTTIQVPKKVVARGLPEQPVPMLGVSLSRRRESKSASARETPTLSKPESGPAFLPEPSPSPLSSSSSLDPSRRYPKRSDEALNDKPEDHTAIPATISEPPRHCLLMDPTVPTPAPQSKRKSLASGPDNRKKRKQAGGGNAELEAGSVPNVVDHKEYPGKTEDGILKNETVSKAGASSSFSSSKCGSRGRETFLVAREAAELLLGRLMDRHDAVYDRALQLFYKEQDVARAIIECVIQAYENPSPSGRLSV